MRIKFDGKRFVIVINQSIEKGNQVMHIDMESGMVDNMEFVKNEDGDTTILRIEGKEVIDDLIAALIKFKQMDI